MLQERLRYLQSQQNPVSNSTPSTLNSTVLPTSSPYPRPMMYNSGNAAPYGHQSMIQPQTVHYNPQAPQASTPQDVVVPPTQMGINTNSMNAPAENMPTIPETVISFFIFYLIIYFDVC